MCTDETLDCAVMGGVVSAGDHDEYRGLEGGSTSERHVIPEISDI